MRSQPRGRRGERFRMRLQEKRKPSFIVNMHTRLNHLHDIMWNNSLLYMIYDKNLRYSGISFCLNCLMMLLKMWIPDIFHLLISVLFSHQSKTCMTTKADLTSISHRMWVSVYGLQMLQISVTCPRNSFMFGLDTLRYVGQGKDYFFVLVFVDNTLRCNLWIVTTWFSAQCRSSLFKARGSVWKYFRITQ